MSKKQIEELKEEADDTHTTEIKTVIMLICMAAYWVMVIVAIFMNPRLDIVLFKGNQTYKQLLEINIPNINVQTLKIKYVFSFRVLPFITAIYFISILPLKIQHIPIQFNHMCQITNLFKIKKTPQRLFFFPDFLLIFYA